MGNTGAEIALDLCNGGARPTISLRNGVHVARRDLFGIPIQIVAMFATRVLPMKANDALLFKDGNKGKFDTLSSSANLAVEVRLQSAAMPQVCEEWTLTDPESYFPCSCPNIPCS
jgi:cation diffusion facilitator CzcD-associated flavoprotein CzcO